MLQDYILPCVYAFAACISFGTLFNIRGSGAVICALGGALAWLVYLLTGPLTGHNDVAQYFWAAVFLSAYSEGMARLRKCPVTGYQLVALLPLVPGGGIYYAMSYCLAGDTGQFLNALLDTLGMAAALAVGVILASSLFRAVFPRLVRPTRSPSSGGPKP